MRFPLACLYSSRSGRGRSGEMRVHGLSSRESGERKGKQDPQSHTSHLWSLGRGRINSGRMKWSRKEVPKGSSGVELVATAGGSGTGSYANHLPPGLGWADTQAGVSSWGLRGRLCGSNSLELASCLGSTGGLPGKEEVSCSGEEQSHGQKVPAKEEPHGRKQRFLA